MLPHFDTYSDAIRIERAVMVKRVNQQGHLFEPTNRPAKNSTRNLVEQVPAPRPGLAGIIRSLRAVLRPAHA